jgi:hypothetical protein
MAELFQTSQALQELSAEKSRRYGLHYAEQITVGSTGMIVGETPLDPVKHSPSAISPISFNEMVLGIPYVQIEVPKRPVEYNVVLHRDVAERCLHPYLQPVREFKTALTSGIARAIIFAKQPSDRVNVFHVGDASEPLSGPWHSETVRDTDEPEAAAKAVEDICMSGLTFVISDFNRLPVNSGNRIARGIAVKANHGIELEIPANVGEISVEGADSVRTWKPKELARANAVLTDMHTTIRQNLGSAGLQVVQLALNNQIEMPYNVRNADTEIASAIRALR